MTEPQTKVALVRCADYQRPNVDRAVGHALDLLGGIAQFVRPGANVLLKPNLLAAWPPDNAVTTHPEIVRTVARAALDAGAHVAVGDSPGIGSLPAVAKKAGIDAVVRELGLALRELDQPVGVPRPDGARFRQLRLTRAALECDTLINLPKVKTHQQMFLTLAVKNLFGCVVGREKVAWHMNAGRDPQLFARVLVEVCHALRPALSIADGVVGMEGSGPSHGTPRPFGFIAASADPFALDAVLTALLGFRHSDLPVLGAADDARRDGLDVGQTELARIQVLGCDIDDLRPGPVTPPVTGRLMFIPDCLARIVRRSLAVRPRIDRTRCVACGICVDSCPAHAMKIVDHQVRIADTACIRCFCCQELCPHGAVQASPGLLWRVLAK